MKNLLKAFKNSVKEKLSKSDQKEASFNVLQELQTYRKKDKTTSDDRNFADYDADFDF